MTKKTINDYLKDAGLNPVEATWEMKKKDKGGKESVRTIVLHKALEQVATHLNIMFEKPTFINTDYRTKQTGVTTWGKPIISDDSHISMLVVGVWNDRSEWSTGEYSPANSTNDYPYAIAEKRGKDRVILKLLGVHGEVYSEMEAESFKKGEVDKEAAKPKTQYGQVVPPGVKVPFQRYTPQPDIEGPDF